MAQHEKRDSDDAAGDGTDDGEDDAEEVERPALREDGEGGDEDEGERAAGGRERAPKSTMSGRVAHERGGVDGEREEHPPDDTVVDVQARYRSEGEADGDGDGEGEADETGERAEGEAGAHGGKSEGAAEGDDTDRADEEGGFGPAERERTRCERVGEGEDAKSNDGECAPAGVGGARIEADGADSPRDRSESTREDERRDGDEKEEVAPDDGREREGDGDETPQRCERVTLGDERHERTVAVALEGRDGQPAVVVGYVGAGEADADDHPLGRDEGEAVGAETGVDCHAGVVAEVGHPEDATGRLGRGVGRAVAHLDRIPVDARRQQAGVVDRDGVAGDGVAERRVLEGGGVVQAVLDGPRRGAVPVDAHRGSAVFDPNGGVVGPCRGAEPALAGCTDGDGARAGRHGGREHDPEERSDEEGGDEEAADHRRGVSARANGFCAVRARKTDLSGAAVCHDCMECGRCGSPLDRPGDYCLVCHTANCDAVVLDVAEDRAHLTMLDGEEVLGETTITTRPEEEGEARVIERRNFAGLIADELRRKRPETVFAAGDRETIRAVRAETHYEFYRVAGEDPVAAVLDRRGERALEVVETAPKEKLGGRHTTLIGGRTGRRAISTVAEHPHVKKIVPGPIDAGGTGSQSGLRAKVTRADGNGNVRLLLRDGSSVQENRIVTTAMNRETGERVRDDLNEALAAADLQE